jgi:uncharacterized membrane protein
MSAQGKRPQDRGVHAKRSQGHWSPAVRLVLGSVGGLIVLKGVRTRGRAGKALTIVGLGLLARAAANLPPRKLVRLGSGRRATEVEKTISLAAPVEQVWELCSNFENFPRFLSHLREVQETGEQRSHWVAVGLGGLPVEWDAIVTDWVPNQFIGWASVEGSPVDTSGRVRFRPTPDGNTEIDIQLSYSPPAGAANDAVATVIGVDPQRAMDEDMVRLTALLEEWKTVADGEAVRLDEAIVKAPGRRPAKSSGSKRSRPRQ